MLGSGVVPRHRVGERGDGSSVVTLTPNGTSKTGVEIGFEKLVNVFCLIVDLLLFRNGN